MLAGVELAAVTASVRGKCDLGIIGGWRLWF